MRINVKEKSRRLETISVGDVLVFKNREERVEEVDILTNSTGTLYTRRDFKSKNLVGWESVAYKNIEKIYPESNGEVYNWKKRLK